VREGWDARNTPWHWALLHTYHQVCKNILEDWSLRDAENHPPPKDIWFDKDELEAWRKDREREREHK